MWLLSVLPCNGVSQTYIYIPVKRLCYWVKWKKNTFAVLWEWLTPLTTFYCQPDMTSSWFLRLWILQAIFYDGFWMSDHYFLLVINSNFLSAMHGFRENVLLLQGGYDFAVISPLGGVSHRFCWRNLKEWPQFHNHGSLTHFAYLLLFRSYSTFYFAR